MRKMSIILILPLLGLLEGVRGPKGNLRLRAETVCGWDLDPSVEERTQT